ncbi:MAG: small metal-binding protein SmbP [Nitrospira sp.]|nr:small metal-binding protein SmbP [Nitrospira sp.]MDH4356503.1 small metal-binding protein SmbP [Nitrospira sp.]MDH5318240.1 small metal-binding protein SmbP [Nitrospira sp.]
MMSRILRSVMLVFGLSALVGAPMLSSSAFAGNKHMSEAVEHAQGAAMHGKEGHADACVEHAGEALKHAQAAGMKNPHLDEAVKHLTEAVKHGKAGHADACTEHANGAAMHLSEVK